MDLNELRQKYDFSGRTALVTGGTGILGGEIACALAGMGANIAILGRNPEMPEDMVKRLDDVSGKYIVVLGDVLNRERLEESERMIFEELGHVDMLVNAAGGGHAGATTSPDLSFFDLPEDALRAVFDLNMLGTLLPSQVFGRRMAESGKGAILNISSMSAMIPLTRVPAYSAAKAGVSNFTQWLATHMAQQYGGSLRVNAIAPGFFLTTQNRYLLYDEQTEGLTQRGKQIIDHTPMGRFGAPEDLLGAALWLLSDMADFVTGAVIPVDGGFSAYGGV